MAGYVVLGIPCGILGIQAGMDLLQITLMSLLFYSGAGQYMIPNMWLAAAPVASLSPVAAIIASVSLINTRQILYAASLSRFCEQTGKRLSFLFAATVTDESFGVNLERFTRGEHAVRTTQSEEQPAVPYVNSWSVAQATGVNLFSLASWTLANVAGALIGSVLAVPVALASFAMTSIFLCLLFMQKFNSATAIAAVVAALGVLACKLLGLTGPAILIGALLGIAAALITSMLAQNISGNKNKSTISHKREP
jgi:predicted branched-subunit amino acid permease